MMTPVAYINVEERKLEWVRPTAWETPTIVANLDPIPLYMKREWVGLPDAEIEEAAESFTEYEGCIHGVVWAEAKLKEKNA